MIDDLWYKNGIFYCLSVGTYMDANGDGFGDFKGLLRRLDYLHGLAIGGGLPIPARKNFRVLFDPAAIVVFFFVIDLRHLPSPPLVDAS